MLSNDNKSSKLIRLFLRKSLRFRQRKINLTFARALSHVVAQYPECLVINKSGGSKKSNQVPYSNCQKIKYSKLMSNTFHLVTTSRLLVYHLLCYTQSLVIHIFLIYDRNKIVKRNDFCSWSKIYFIMGRQRRLVHFLIIENDSYSIKMICLLKATDILN